MLDLPGDVLEDVLQLGQGLFVGDGDGPHHQFHRKVQLPHVLKDFRPAGKAEPPGQPGEGEVGKPAALLAVGELLGPLDHPELFPEVQDDIVEPPFQIGPGGVDVAVLHHQLHRFLLVGRADAPASAAFDQPKHFAFAAALDAGVEFLPDALEDFLLRLFESFPLAPGKAIGFAAHDVVDEGHGIPDDLIEVAGDLLAQVSGGRFQVDGKIEGMPVGDHFPDRLRRGPDVFLPGLEPVGGNLGSALFQYILGGVGNGDLPPGQGVGKFIEEVGQMIAQVPVFPRRRETRSSPAAPGRRPGLVRLW